MPPLFYVILIIGIAGACRREEITNLLVTNVKDEGICYQVVIPNTKTKMSREFFYNIWKYCGFKPGRCSQKYIKLRPNNCEHNRFLVVFQNLLPSFFSCVIRKSIPDIVFDDLLPPF